ncbi:hypothetical protein FS749_001332 [Ceratobasidium sp. UAMH 11750]|nr:hypothetical protein FS749_001332 [Ceratobasidium sp. UAMH 11750]
MSNIRLRPIVIGPIVLGPFTCLGEGLLYEGIEREQLDNLYNLLVPARIAKSETIEEQSRKWWKAQCAHYGINVSQSTSIDTCQRRPKDEIMEHGELKVPRDLADIESRLNIRFRRRNARELERRERAGTAPSTPESGIEPKYEPVDSDIESVATVATTSSKRKREDVHAHGDDKEELQSSSAPADLEQGVVRHAKQPRHAFDHSPSHSRRSSLQPSSSQTAVQGGILVPYGKIYRLEYTSSANAPSQGTPILRVFGLLFEVLLEIPGFKFPFRIRSDANTRLDNNSYVPSERYDRNEWGMEVRSPVSENTGWLKLDHAGGQVKGVIRTPTGDIPFQGSRVAA